MCMKRVLGRIGLSFAAGLVYVVEAPAGAFIFLATGPNLHKFSAGGVVASDEVCTSSNRILSTSPLPAAKRVARS